MKKKENIDNLLTGGLNLKEKSESNSLYLEISEKLSSNEQQDNAKAVAAILKVEELTGKEPEFEAPNGTGIKRCLGQDIREGLITPSAESEKMYSLNKKEPLPGKKDLSDQEIGLQDMQIGLESAGYQSGMKPSSKDRMALDMLSGQSQEDKLGSAPLGEKDQDMSFGPSKVLKGLLTGDAQEIKKGLDQTLKIGAVSSLKENLTELSPIFKPMQKLSEFIGNLGAENDKMQKGLVDSMIKDIVGDPNGQDKNKSQEKEELGMLDIMGAQKGQQGFNGLDNLEGLRESLENINNRFSTLVGEVSDAFKSGKVGKETTALIDISKNGSLEDVENHVEELFGKIGKKMGKDSEEEPGEAEKAPAKQTETPDFNARLAGSIAGAATYKAGRSKGVNPKKAGEMGAIAEDEATDIAKSTQNSDKSKDNAVDMAKNTKNMMAKTASAIADKIPAPPGLGKAIAVGIIIADKATDLLMDLINNKGGLEVLNKSGGSLEGADQAKTEPNQQQQTLSGGVDVFKQEMKKTKGGMVKKLIPTTDEIASTAMKGAVDGIMSWGKEQVKGKKGTADDMHKQVDQPS